MSSDASTKLETVTKAVRNVFVRGGVDLLRKPNAALGYWRHLAQVAAHSVDLDSGCDLAIPTQPIGEILPNPDSIPVTLQNYTFFEGDMALHELLALCRLIKWKLPQTVFEIGTFQGGTTLQIAANSQAAIHTLDLPPASAQSMGDQLPRQADIDVYPDTPGIRFHNTAYAPRITQHYGDSRVFDFSPFRGLADVVFVDACHHYEFVRHDTENALQIVRPDGLILWHDYAAYAPGVVQALNELNRTRRLVNIAGTSLVLMQNGK